MLAYRQTLIVENPNTLVLHDLPLQTDQSVEVFILVNETNKNIPNIFSFPRGEAVKELQFCRIWQ